MSGPPDTTRPSRPATVALASSLSPPGGSRTGRPPPRRTAFTYEYGSIAARAFQLRQAASSSYAVMPMTGVIVCPFELILSRYPGNPLIFRTNRGSTSPSVFTGPAGDVEWAAVVWRQVSSVSSRVSEHNFKSRPVFTGLFIVSPPPSLRRQNAELVTHCGLRGLGRICPDLRLLPRDRPPLPPLANHRQVCRVHSAAERSADGRRSAGALAVHRRCWFLPA